MNPPCASTTRHDHSSGDPRPVVSDSCLEGEARDLRQHLGEDSVVKFREPLGPKTTLKVGGAADLYVIPGCLEDLTKTLQWALTSSKEVHFLGRGSNVLVPDEGVRGVVVSLSSQAFLRLEVQDHHLCAGVGVRLKQISEKARQHGLSGLEFLEGIPGCVGGALRMNAGAMGKWTFDALVSMTVMDRSGNLSTLKSEAIETTYRSCPMLSEHIAIEATFEALPASEGQVRAIMDGFATQRRGSQPIGASAGCTFKNPDTCPAGKLIEELGLKGQRHGQAMVSDVHGNFIVNLGGATAAEVLSLIDLIQKRAREERGLELEVEVQILGQ